MPPITPPIHKNEVSDNVANLHLVLSVLLPTLGFPDFKIPEEERLARQALTATAEGIMLLQEKWNLHQQPNPVESHPELMAPNPDVLVDAELAERINQEMEKFYIVQGRVTLPDGQGLEGHQVTLSEYDLEGSLDLQKTVTNVDGAFHFVFDYSKELKRGDGKTQPDLWLQVTAPDGTMPSVDAIFWNVDDVETAVPRLAESPRAPIVLMNVTRYVMARIVVAAKEEPQLTEFERLVNALRPLVRDKNFADLLEDETNFQISFLSKESGIPKAKIEALKSAFTEERNTQLPAWAFFGLSQLPLAASQWSESSLEEFIELLKPLEPQGENTDFKTLAEKLREHALAHTQEQDIRKKTEQLITVSGPLLQSFFDGTQHIESFFTEYAAHTDTIPKFWEKMKVDDRFKEKVPEIQLTLQLSQLTLNNAGLVAQLKLKGIQETKALIHLPEQEWIDMIKVHPEGIPAHIAIDPDLSDEENLKTRAAIYANELQTVVEIAFPTEVIKTKMGSAGFNQFLDHYPDFDFTQHPVETLLHDATEASWSGIDNREAVMQELRQTQRLYNLTASAKDAMALASHGFSSAFDIANIPLVDFETRMKKVMPAEQAGAIQSKAVAIAEANAMILAQLRDAGNKTAPAAIGKPAEVQTVLPQWSNLFGEITTCECEHCRSVYSPAAYFVDLLHILLGQGKSEARLELFRRRPDLKFTKLSCEHTDTLIPYIDLVNEILETYVVQQNFGTTAAETYAKDATNDTSAFTEEELAANPQHPNALSLTDAENAYKLLSEAYYPLNLPFDLNLETAREFLASQGTSRLALMNAFVNPRSNATLAEGLGLSAVAFEIFVGMYPEKQPDNSIKLIPWTVDHLFGTGPSLSQAKEFLSRTAIHYLDLVALTNSQFLNPEGKIGHALVAPNNIQDKDRDAWDIAHNCDLTVTHLIEGTANLLWMVAQGKWNTGNVTYIKDENLLKFNRFIRLWKKLGCTIEELDALLMAVDGTTTHEFTPQLLQDLSELWQFAHSQEIPIAQAALLLGQIPTRGENALYFKLFQNKAILQIDAGFAFDKENNELLDTTSTLADHIPALLSALQITEQGLREIAELLDPQNKMSATLNLRSLSAIYRLQLFAKLNRISVHEMYLLRGFLTPLPWTNVTELLAAQTLVNQLKAADLKAGAIAYLFGDVVEAGNVLVPKAEVIQKFQTDLSVGLAQIGKSMDLGDKPMDAQFLRTQLGLVLDEPELDKLIAILDGSNLKKDELGDDGTPLIAISAVDGAFVEKPGFKKEYETVFTAYLSAVDMAAISAATTVIARYSAFWTEIQNELRYLKRSIFVKQHIIAHFQVDAQLVNFVFPGIESTFLSQDAPTPPPIVDAYTVLFKFFWLAKKFGLSAAELTHFQANRGNFEDFNWNDFSPVRIHAWLQVAAYCQLRNALPNSNHSLIAVFETAKTSSDPTQAIVDATGYDHDNVAYFVGRRIPVDFINEKVLVLLQRQIRLSQQIGISIPKLEAWCKDVVDLDTAQDIKRSLKAKYDEESWLSVSTQVHNRLRNVQRDALVDYLLQSAAIQALNVTLQAQSRPPIINANGLYAYFLIDVEMDAVMKTSRLKQAIASVQLFTMRCIMNLEPTISPLSIDQKQWSWMKYYRVWEANRKVFLYPENWIEPELRDGKSPFFKELESELLQGEVTNESVEKAIQNYLYKLDDVARLDICGMYEDQEGGELHVFGRTFNNPPIYYYRKLDLFTHVWTAWEKVQLDIQGNDDGANPGVHLIPVVWNSRLYLFWPVFREKSLLKNGSAESYWEIKLAWSEYRQKNWSPKKSSSEHISTNSKGTLGSYRWYVECSDLLILHLWGPRSSDNQHFQFEEKGQMKGPFPTVNVFLGKVMDNAINHYQGVGNTLIPSEFSLYDFGKGMFEKKQILAKGSGFSVLYSSDHDFNANRTNRFIYQDNERCYFVNPDGVLFFNATVGLKDLKMVTIETSGKQEILPKKEKKISTTSYGNVDQLQQLSMPQIVALLDQQDVTMQTGLQYLALGEKRSNALEVAKNFKTASTNIAEKYIDFNAQSRSSKLDFQDLFHAHVGGFVGALYKEGFPGLLTLKNQQLNDLKRDGIIGIGTKGKFEIVYKPNADIVRKPYPLQDIDFSITGTYSLYNWELFFHIPMLLANRLSQNQKFEEAMRWYHYVFNPTTNDADRSEKRYWQVIPLRNTAKETLEVLMQQLKNPQGDPRRKELEEAITAWRKNPFNPHLIARMRLAAYKKNVLMKYLDNMIAWADNLFRQDTIENINQATQLYIIAAELLGPRPDKVPLRGNIEAKTYAELETAGLNAFSNAQVQMETIVPFFNLQEVQTNSSGSTMVLSTTVAADYFGLPDNPKLLGYWDTVADRLFKIRHSLNIEGVERTLALYEPPIDPALLVQAVAKGIDISSVLADLNAPLPYYRFNYIVQKALEICSELKSLGNSLLSALEKKDNETLWLMRTEHETTMLGLMKSIKQLQITESQRNREGLEKTLDVTEQRRSYYADLVKVDLLPEEQEQAKKLQLANERQDDAAMVEIAAGLAHILPNYSFPGWTFSFGGTNIGFGLNAWARSINNLASGHTFEANKSATKASNDRRLAEWKQQQELAQKELLQIQKQIDAAKFREQIADKDLSNHEQQIDNARQVEDYLRNKFTQEELYGWMIGEISTVYFQCYQLVYDLAKKAEKTYRHELGIETSSFVQFGVWDSFRKGLLSGERLYLSLKQMEKAYMDQNRREYELTKHVSLSMLDPMALIRLRTTGICDFEIPEALYDMDHPGQYFRRLKSVSVSIPCIVGPYTSVSAKLTLIKSRYRYNADSGGSYPEAPGNNNDASRFKYTLGAIQSIATSHGQNDSGMFELNFRDERYLPFEYAGAISTWRLELPTEVKQFDYNTISDVIVHVQYTAREGGSGLKTAANNALTNQLKMIKQGLGHQGLHLAINMKHDLPNEWNLLKKSGEIDLTIDQSRLPYMVQFLNPKIKDVVFIAKTEDNPSPFLINAAEKDLTLNIDDRMEVKIGVLTTGIILNKPFKFIIKNNSIQHLTELLMVVNYEFNT